MPTLTPYNKDGLQIVFSLNKVPDSNCLTINVVATNHTVSNMTDFLFQVAVPRVSITNTFQEYSTYLIECIEGSFGFLS